jgi:hypothetical protein
MVQTILVVAAVVAVLMELIKVATTAAQALSFFLI